MNPLAWTSSVTLDTGVIVTYWVIKKMIVDMATAQAEVLYYGYISQDPTFDQVIQSTVTIDFSDFDPDGSLATGVGVLVQAAQALKISQGGF